MAKGATSEATNKTLNFDFSGFIVFSVAMSVGVKTLSTMATKFVKFIYFLTSVHIKKNKSQIVLKMILLFIALNGVATCRAQGQKMEKGCPLAHTNSEMSCIPEGFFLYGSDNSQYKDERPAQKVWLSAFFIDKYEVSVSQYKKCVKAKKCKNVTSNYTHMRKEAYPQLKVSWYDARDYCQFMDKRLPTEAEFEKASRGPDGEIYSWGNEKATCKNAVIFSGKGRGCTDQFQKTGSVANVGSKGAYRYGLYDMTGNAHEWVNDWYAPNRKKCGVDCLGKNPQGPCSHKDSCPENPQKVVKGGSWYWNADWARAAKRRAYIPLNKPPHHFGFRCAKDRQVKTN